MTDCFFLIFPCGHLKMFKTGLSLESNHKTRNVTPTSAPSNVVSAILILNCGAITIVRLDYETCALTEGIR